MLGISFWSTQSTLKDHLDIHQIFAMFMSCQLSEEQKENHVSMSQDLQDRFERNPELSYD
jgi:hypothetical protein